MKSVFTSQRPKTRSELRMFLGKLYYTLRRYFQWLFKGSIKYAATIRKTQLPYIVTAHKTPLFRQLRQVDRWLQENKTVNLKLAAKKINGLVLRPGETFSFWRLIGKPTRAKGFLDGLVLTNGAFTAGVGGGLCQLSNLIYWLTLNSSLTVTERWRHTHDVFPDANRTQPFGSGATVVYNYVDLQIRNDTAYEYQLMVEVGDSDLEGQWLSEQPAVYQYEVYESEHYITQEWWGGYLRHNVIRRKVFKLGAQVDDELITENHAIMMYEPMLAESAGHGQSN